MNRIFIAVAAVFATACGGSSGGASVALSSRSVSLAKVAGDGQTGLVSSTLSPFKVRVTDNNGSPASGVTVDFQLVAGSGALSATQLATDSNGEASTSLTLGPVAGAHAVQAQAPGSNAVVFIADAISVNHQTTSTLAMINDASYVLSTPNGTLLVSTRQDGQVLEVDLNSGNVLRAVVDRGGNQVVGCALEGSSLYVSCRTEHLVVEYDYVTGALIGTVAGNGSSGFGGDGGPADQALLTFPTDVAFRNGQLLIADLGNDAIRAVDLSSNLISTVASVSSPINVEVANGETYIVDSTGILELSSAGVLRTIFSGGEAPSYVALDPQDGRFIFVSNSQNRLYKVLGATTATPIAGSGASGGADGPLLSATFDGMVSCELLPGRILAIAERRPPGQPGRVRLVPLP